MSRIIVYVLMFNALLLGSVSADPVYKATSKAPFDEVYGAVVAALEEARLFAVFEANPGRVMAGFKERWGDDYNRQRLQNIRNIVVCNVWYVNQVANLDPDMLSLCPLRIGLYSKADVTSVVFARPTLQAQGSAALPVIAEVEKLVIDAIDSAVR